MLISDAVENPVHRGAPWQAAGGQHYSVFNETAIVRVIPGPCTAKVDSSEPSKKWRKCSQGTRAWAKVGLSTWAA